MDALWIAAALAAAVIGGWPVTAGILKFTKSSAVRAIAAPVDGDVPFAGAGPEPEPEPEPGPGPESGPGPAPGSESEPEPGPAPVAADVLRGGLLIGFLERGAVAVAILSGQPVAIAYVVAIKGLGRYPELKNTPAASERFIIGTLASMLWSASVVALVKVLFL